MNSTTFNAMSFILKDTVTLESLRFAAELEVFRELEQVINPEAEELFSFLRVNTPLLPALEYEDCVDNPTEPFQRKVDGVVVTPSEAEIHKIKLARAFFQAYSCYNFTSGNALEYARTFAEGATLKQFCDSSFTKEQYRDEVVNLPDLFEDTTLISDLIEYEDITHKYYLLQYNNLLNNESKELSLDDMELFNNSLETLEASYNSQQQRISKG